MKTSFEIQRTLSLSVNEARNLYMKEKTPARLALSFKLALGCFEEA